MRLIDGDALIKRLDYCVSQGLGGNIAHMFGHMVDEAPTVDAIPIQYILTTIREWNRDGYAESAEALEILVMNWDKENTEWAEREEE